LPTYFLFNTLKFTSRHLAVCWFPPYIHKSGPHAGGVLLKRRGGKVGPRNEFEGCPYFLSASLFWVRPGFRSGGGPVRPGASGGPAVPARPAARRSRRVRRPGGPGASGGSGRGGWLLSPARPAAPVRGGQGAPASPPAPPAGHSEAKKRLKSKT